MRALMKEDREESVRDAAMDAMTRLGFYNPLSGALKQRYVYFNACMVIFGYFWLFLVILVIVCAWAIGLTSCFVQLSQGFLQSPAKSRADRAAKEELAVTHARVRGWRDGAGVVAGRRRVLRSADQGLGSRAGRAHTAVHPGRRRGSYDLFYFHAYGQLD
jgi:hypothetical protein